MNENNKKIRDLVVLYDKLLNHLDTLSLYSKSIEDAKLNIVKIKELNQLHKKTRNFARELLQFDFSKLSPNFLMTFMFKEINSQSILFINLVTDYNERLVEYVEKEDDNKLNLLIRDIINFNEKAKKQFNPIKNKLGRIVKDDEVKRNI